jgi:hypothetical protein
VMVGGDWSSSAFPRLLYHERNAPSRWPKEPWLTWAKLCLSSPSRLNGVSCTLFYQFQGKLSRTRARTRSTNRPANSTRYPLPDIVSSRLASPRPSRYLRSRSRHGPVPSRLTCSRLHLKSRPFARSYKSSLFWASGF